MRSFIDIVKFIWSHPLSSQNRVKAFRRFFAWQTGQQIMNFPVLYPFVEDSVLLIEKGMAGATGNIYTGLLEFEDMAFILHVLRNGDVFCDVGANVGAYTILASKNAGARVLSIEPVPVTFRKLAHNVAVNDVNDLVTLLPFGAADESGTLRFTQNMDAINHVASEGENSGNQITIEIPVRSLDELTAEHQPVIMKMDVEGFEWPALQGSRKLLAPSSKLKGLVIELNGSGKRYGFSEKEIHRLLLSNGFNPYRYHPFTRNLERLDEPGNLNTIYLRDIEWILERIRTARKYLVLGREI